MRPPSASTYRLDAGVDVLYDCARGRLSPSRLERLNHSLDVITAAGAEPIVILDYMPACLAATVPGDVRAPRLLPPRDPARWQALMTELVTALVPGRARAHRVPVRYFEAWNEPDGLFWQSTLADYVTGVLLPAGRACGAVAATSSRPVRFSVGATTFPDPAWQVPLLRAAAAAQIPVGFVSWHYYANYPLLGPDGGEPGENPALAAAAGHANPAADPITFSAGVSVMRAAAQAALGRVPELVLDEWNLSAGGFDLRNDSFVGAAFQAATLLELAAAGLDRALLYASVDPHTSGQDGKALPVRHGDWGVVDRTGGRKPAWYAQEMFGWLRGAPLGLALRPEPDLWLAGTSDGSRVHVLAAAFTAHASAATGPHQMTVVLTGLRPGPHRARLARIDAQHTGAEAPSLVRVTADAGGTARLALRLEPNAVAAVDMDR